jgi:hypothetical protein
MNSVSVLAVVLPLAPLWQVLMFLLMLMLMVRMLMLMMMMMMMKKMKMLMLMFLLMLMLMLWMLMRVQAHLPALVGHEASLCHESEQPPLAPPSLLPLAPPLLLLVRVWVWVWVRARVWVRVLVKVPSVFGRNLQSQPVRGSERPRGMPLVTRMQELQAKEQRRETQRHPRV